MNNQTRLLAKNPLSNTLRMTQKGSFSSVYAQVIVQYHAPTFWFLYQAKENTTKKKQNQNQNPNNIKQPKGKPLPKENTTKPNPIHSPAEHPFKTQRAFLAAESTGPERGQPGRSTRRRVGFVVANQNKDKPAIEGWSLQIYDFIHFRLP